MGPSGPSHLPCFPSRTQAGKRPPLEGHEAVCDVAEDAEAFAGEVLKLRRHVDVDEVALSARLRIPIADAGAECPVFG